MGMKLVKKTAEYSIYLRGDERYAVKDSRKKSLNGEEKLRILQAESLVKVLQPAKPAVAEEAAEAGEAVASDETAAEAGESEGVEEVGEQ